MIVAIRPTSRIHPLREGSEQVCEVLELPASAGPSGGGNPRAHYG